MILYPLSDQIADKVCAMYELHGDQQNPSSRYRDLVDLVLIVTSSDLAADPIARALQSEATRRRLRLPTRLDSPGQHWPAGYLAIARRTKLEAKLHAMDTALEVVGDCINPLLDGTRTTGTWTLDHGWTD